MSGNLNSTLEVTALEQEAEMKRRRKQELAAALEEAEKGKQELAAALEEAEKDEASTQERLAAAKQLADDEKEAKEAERIAAEKRKKVEEKSQELMPKAKRPKQAAPSDRVVRFHAMSPTTRSVEMEKANRKLVARQRRDSLLIKTLKLRDCIYELDENERTPAMRIFQDRLSQYDDIFFGSGGVFGEGCENVSSPHEVIQYLEECLAGLAAAKQLADDEKEAKEAERIAAEKRKKVEEKRQELMALQAARQPMPAAGEATSSAPMQIVDRPGTLAIGEAGGKKRESSAPAGAALPKAKRPKRPKQAAPSDRVVRFHAMSPTTRSAEMEKANRKLVARQRRDSLLIKTLTLRDCIYELDENERTPAMRIFQDRLSQYDDIFFGSGGVFGTSGDPHQVIQYLEECLADLRTDMARERVV